MAGIGIHAGCALAWFLVRLLGFLCSSVCFGLILCLYWPCLAVKNVIARDLGIGETGATLHLTKYSGVQNAKKRPKCLARRLVQLDGVAKPCQSTICGSDLRSISTDELHVHTSSTIPSPSWLSSLSAFELHAALSSAPSCT